MKSAYVLCLGICLTIFGCGKDVVDVSADDAGPPADSASPTNVPATDVTQAASGNPQKQPDQNRQPTSQPGPWARAKEFEWQHGQPDVMMMHRDEGFAYLTGVRGALPAGSEVSILPNPEGHWKLNGSDHGNLSGRGVACPWFVDPAWTPEMKVWSTNKPDFPKLIHKRDGFAVLLKIGGAINGANVQFRLRVDDAGNWRLNARSRSRGTRVRVAVIKLKQPGTFGGVPREHKWTSGDEPLRLIHKNDGIAFLSGLTGSFLGQSDYARVTLHEDGYWYLEGQSANRGNIIARAMTIRLSETETTPPVVAANDPPPQRIPPKQGNVPKTTVASQKQSPRTETSTPSADDEPDDFEDLLPYVHHDFCAAVVTYPHRITRSLLGGKSFPLSVLMASVSKEDKLEGVDPEQVARFANPDKIRRLTLLVDPFPGGNVGFLPGFVVEYVEDTPGAEVIRAVFPKSRPSATEKGLFVDLDAMAGESIHAYVAGRGTILVAPASTLEKMRSKFRRPGNPLLLQLRTKAVESEVVVEYASKPALTQLLALTGYSKTQLQADPQTDPSVKMLLLDVTSASLHVGLQKAPSIRATVRCADRTAATALEETIKVGMIGLEAMSESANLRKELPPPAREFVASTAMKDLLRATQIERKGTDIEVRFAVPKSVLDLARDAVAKLVASAEPLPDDGDWIVIFRSDDPAVWNTNVDDGPARFAIPLSRVPDGIKYLRMKIDKERFAIVEVTRDNLGKRVEKGQIGWEGTNHLQWNGRHLGIYDRRWTDQVRGTIQILPLQNQGVRGWGFGNRTQLDDRQGYSWAGKEVPKTVFEIAVKSGQLTTDERKALLK